MKARAISASLPDGWPGLAFRGLAGLALLAELPLVWNKIDGTEGSRWLALLVFLPLGVPLLLWKIKFPGWLHMGVAAGTAGGLAMLIGNSLDQAQPETVRNCCCLMTGAGANTGSRALLTWSGGLMMLACLVSSLLLCPGTPVSLIKPASWMKHLCCFGGMWLGMSLGSHWLIPGFTEFFGKEGGRHMAMVAGMMAGAGLSHMLFLRQPLAALH